MIKFEDGRIGFNSTLKHRLVERARHQLKKAGIKNIKTQYHDSFVYIMQGEYNSETIKIHILMRLVKTDYVAMNMDSYSSDMKYDVNSLLVLVDRRHLYPVKFMWFNNINSRTFINASNQAVLFPEADFINIEELRDILKLTEMS